MQQIAKMFATLGFNVDTTGLNTFTKLLREARADTSLLARNARVLKDNINEVNKSLYRLNGNLRIKRADNRLTDSYEKFKLSIQRVDQAFKSISANQSSTTKAMGRINASVIKGEDLWKKYADQVQRTRDLLRSTNEQMRQIRSNSTIRSNVIINNSNSGSGRGSSSNPSQNQNQNNNNGSSTIVPFGGFRRGAGDFFRSMMPAVALGGGAGAVGYLAKETVQQGRGMMRMENIMTAATKSTEEFTKAMQYVRVESNRLGQDVQEMGMGFAKVLQSASGKMSLEKTQRLFTGLGELMTVLGSNADDQKGVYRALGQMLSKGKVEAEEVGQLAERGITRELVRQAAVKAYGIKNSEYDAFQKAGKVKIPDIADEIAKLASSMARNNGALEKSLNTSQVAQQRFQNRLKELAKTIMDNGLDTALAKIFSGLTNLADVLEDVGTGLKFVVDGWKQLANLLGGKGIVYTGLALVLMLLLRKTAVISALIVRGGTLRTMFTRLSAFMRGGLGRAILTLGKRLFWIVGLFEILALVGSTLNDKMAGKTTWMDVWEAKITLLGLNMKYWFNDMIIGANNAAMAITRPWKNFQDWQFDSFKGRVSNNAYKSGILKPEFQPQIYAPKSNNIPRSIAAPDYIPRMNNDVKNITQQMGEKLSSQQRPIQITMPIYLDNQLSETKNALFFADASTLMG